MSKLPATIPAIKDLAKSGAAKSGATKPAAAPAAKTPLELVRSKIRAIVERMTSCLVERDEEVSAIILALLCRQHALFVGEPGTAKSMLCESILRAVKQASLYKYMVTAYTDPQEILGMWDVPAMQNGILRRHTDRTLVTAHFAFIDEFFRGSTAILTSFLNIMQERRIVIAKDEIACPLQMMVAAANHFPGDDGDMERASLLQAPFDRFLVRRQVHTIRSFTGLQKLCCTPRHELVPTFTEDEQISLEELKLAQDAVQTVRFTEASFVPYFELMEKLSAQGIQAGNRRIQFGTDICRAQAWLDGADEVKMTHFEPLKNVLWTDPGQISKVSAVVLEAANPFKMKILKLLDDLSVNYEALEKPGTSVTESYARTAKIEDMKKELNDLMPHALTRDQRNLFNSATKQYSKILVKVKERSHRISAGIPLK